MVTCPQCKAVIPDSDYNVSTDIALCRRCNTNFKYSDIVGSSQLQPITQLERPKQIKIFEGVDYTEITYKRLNPVLLFLIPFTAFWSGLSMYGIYGKQIRSGKFDLGDSLFGIPFLLGTIVLITVIFSLLFGKWRIKIGYRESYVFAGVGPIGWKRRFESSNVRNVTLKMTSLQVNNVPQEGVHLAFKEGDGLTFGATLKQNAKEYIASYLSNWIATRRF